MKICSTCKIEKELEDFYKCKSKKDGLSNECKECNKTRAFIKSKTIEYKIKRKEWEGKNKDKLKAYGVTYSKIYYKDNKDKYAKRYTKWRENNIERARELERNNFQNPSRKHKHRINQAQRRAKKLKATIPGFEKQIAEIYNKCPVGFHVDHIIPLRGKNVSGLHVPWNLQYLSPEDNRKKGNRVIL